MEKHCQRLTLDEIKNDSSNPKVLEISDYLTFPKDRYENIIKRAKSYMEIRRDEQLKNSSESVPYVAITGYKRHEKLLLARMVSLLGGKVADGDESIEKVSHIVSEGLIITPNFLTTFCYTKYIVNCSWLLESYLKQKFLNEKDFELKNSPVENETKISLQTALEKRSKPLKDYFIYFCKSVQIEGKWLFVLAKQMGATILSKMPKLSQLREKNYIVVGETRDRVECCNLFKKNIPIYHVTVLSLILLKQTVLFIPEWQIVNAAEG